MTGVLLRAHPDALAERRCRFGCDSPVVGIVRRKDGVLLREGGVSIHPRDKGSDNPRLQCSVCRRWMRLRGKRLEVVDGETKEVAVQRFYGGCDFNNGGDHLAGTVDAAGYNDGRGGEHPRKPKS